MTTLQEWLEQKYPNKDEVREIKIDCPSYKEETLKIENYPNLEKVWINGGNLKSSIANLIIVNCPKISELALINSELTDIDLSHCPNLIKLDLPWNKLINVDFLATLPNPEKLEKLSIFNNLIQPTTLEFVKRFSNLKALLLGIDKIYWERRQKANLFYGSLEPLKYLNKLERLCIAGTDIDSGLEYLPNSLVQKNKKVVTSAFSDINDNNVPDCQIIRPEAKVRSIQDQLRPFNYELEAWRLANTNLVNSADKISQLEAKIKETEEQLSHVRQNEANKTKKIERLESKLAILEETKANLTQINNNLLTELAQLKKDKEDLDNKLKSHDQVIAQFQQNLSDLQAQLDHKQQELKNLTRLNKQIKLNDEYSAKAWKKRCEELNNQIAQEREETLVLQKKFLTKVVELQKKITSLKETIEAKESELQQLRDTTAKSTSSLREEITTLKKELQTTQTEKKSKDTQIAELNSQLDSLQTQLASLQTDNQDKDATITKLNADLQALALSTAVLTQQAESLKQETQNQQFKLELEQNLSQQKDNTLSEQEQKIKDNQFLLRHNDEQLSKLQQLINQRTNQLEQSEQEKNNLANLLEKAEAKITSLESSLLVAQTKISELETKIKDLEQSNPNSSELARYKAELSNLKSSSQSEINNLKNQLTQAKNKEQELVKKIQGLTSKTEAKTEREANPVNNSYWEQIKTPLLAVGGILALVGIVNYFKKKD